MIAVPSLSAPDPCDCWRNTTDGPRAVPGGFCQVEGHANGNAATAGGSPFSRVEEHFLPDVLDVDDPTCPTFVAVGAWA